MLDEDLLRVRQLVALGTGWKRRWFRMPNSLRPRILLEEKGRRRKWRKGKAEGKKGKTEGEKKRRRKGKDGGSMKMGERYRYTVKGR